MMRTDQIFRMAYDAAVMQFERLARRKLYATAERRFRERLKDLGFAPGEIEAEIRLRYLKQPKE